MFKHLVFASTIGIALLFAGCQPGSPSAGPESVTPAGEAVDPRVTHRLQLTDGEVATEFQGQPAFGLLLAGRGSNEAFWLAVDDEALYLDRNQDGVFAGDDERIPWAGRGADQPVSPVEVGSLGGSSYQVSAPASDAESESEGMSLAKQTTDWQSLDRIRLAIRQIDLDDSETIDLWLDPSWEDAPITHVTGFLQPGLKWKDDTYLSRSQDNKFEIQIGVSQYLAGEPARRTFPTLLHREFSADVYPIAVFRYPHRDGSSGPIEQEVHLRERC